MAKVLALGADAVAIATAAMMAIGCQQYRACHRGTCPVGIATQDPKLRARFDVATSKRQLTRFLTAATVMMSDYCRITGRHSFTELSPDDLAALHPQAADLLELSLIG
ncbi:MAG TPA: glutamate synthase-related protein [Miltoncostaeaceae bacterium]|nr:glutamate synthase-related protein [Miltoncostaeaceae bacterium]